MQPDHPDYAFFLMLLTKVCEAATKNTMRFRSIGAALDRLTAGDQVTADGMVQLRRMAETLQSVDLSPDINAIRAIFPALKARVVEIERQSANREREQTQRNTQIQTQGSKLLALGMSQRAAARRIRSEMGLCISAERIRQIAYQK